MKKILSVLLSIGLVLPTAAVYAQSNTAESQQTAIPENSETINLLGSSTIKTVTASFGGGYDRQMTSYISTARWSHIIRSYIYDNGNGTFTVVDADSDDTIYIDTYNSTTMKKISSETMSYPLELFGGFYHGEKYNYIVCGQSNEEENDDKEVIRIIKYDKNFKKIDSLSVYGGESITIDPFHAGSLRMSEYGNELIVHTTRQRYTSDDGLNHQSQLSLIIDTDTMTLKKELEDFQENHVSHSFNQFIIHDKGTHIFADHGDAYPRSIALSEYNGYYYNEINMFDIPGDIGANCTGVTMGGFESSVNNYIVAVNTIDHSKATDYDSFNIYGLDKDERDVLILIKDKYNSDNAVNEVYLTDYVDNSKLASTPYLVKMSDNHFIVLWEEFEYKKNSTVSNGVKYVHIDENGKKLTDIQTADDAHLSYDCQPVKIGKNLIWYINGEKKRTFYVMPNDTSVVPPIASLPFTSASIKKSETDTEYTFTVNADKKYANCYVYAAVYDAAGKLIQTNRVPLDTFEKTTVSVAKNNNAKKIKIFLWDGTIQPVIETAEEFNL